MSTTAWDADLKATRDSHRGAGRELAVYGGPRAVTRKYRDRWRTIRLPELLAIGAYGLSGRSTQFGGGGIVGHFEKLFCDLTDARYAVLLNSGTAALHSAYLAVGVSVGDEVIVPSYTFFASAAPVLQCGGRPVFCDIDEQTLTADPEDVERRITPKTKAICVVHLWGNPARMDRFAEIARKHGVAIVEDCSHAHGASFQGRPVGSWGDIGCFSLQGQKPVSGGEAGIATTNDPVLYDRMLAVGHFGRSETHAQSHTIGIENLSYGIKYRPHLYAVLLAYFGLRRLPELNRRRRANYAMLERELSDCPALQPIASYPESERGGFLEFLFRYRPEKAGGADPGFVLNALRAEGVPLEPERYGTNHTKRIFTTPIPDGLGGALGALAQQPFEPVEHWNLPVTERVCPQLFTMPPLTTVSPIFIRQCTAAMRKVVEVVPGIRDFRTGD